jgi:hypothetical protein
MEKSFETMEKSIEPMANSMTTMEKSMTTLGKSMNTMEKSMISANGKFKLQNSAKYTVLLQNVANSKEKCPRLKIYKKKHKQKNHPFGGVPKEYLPIMKNSYFP